MPKKKNSILIRLNSTGLKKDGKTKTGFFKTTSRNRNPSSENKEKIHKKCFDPRAWDKEKQKFGMHVEFKEGKIK
ncbi:MAG: 50S ribosomal protein L33 [Pseudomonadota bacterium]